MSVDVGPEEPAAGAGAAAGATPWAGMQVLAGTAAPYDIIKDVTVADVVGRGRPVRGGRGAQAAVGGAASVAGAAVTSAGAMT